MESVQGTLYFVEHGPIVEPEGPMNVLTCIFELPGEVGYLDSAFDHPLPDANDTGRKS